MAKVLQKCAMTCPECGGHNVDLYEDNKEVRTSANLKERRDQNTADAGRFSYLIP